MKRIFVFIALLGLFTVPLWAKAHTVKFYTTVVVNGVEIEPGKYKLELNDESQAELSQNGKVLVSAKVEIQPLGNANPGSVSRKKDGTLIEIRLDEQRVVFVKS